ncbi:hypothetical protein [Streptomyces sp. NRRL B-3648]|uniref:hypothetical protein n=1 Tax=Streptomyces sp. NRRL B-3648 TaxID=1519493 RepID=UPI000AF1D0A0|nr:hypothetical protein [Streptomyces sp. NRRL B-3648]
MEAAHGPARRPRAFAAVGAASGVSSALVGSVGPMVTPSDVDCTKVGRLKK